MMTQIKIVDIGPSLSERLFKNDPKNDCEKAGHFISAAPTFVVGWVGRAIKQINSLDVRLENACKYDDVESIAMKIAKYSGYVFGKIGLLVGAAAMYLTFSVATAVDLLGIAVRTFGLPLDDDRKHNTSDDQVDLSSVLTENYETNEKPAETPRVPSFKRQLDALEIESMDPKGKLEIGSRTVITYPAPKALEA